MLTGTVTHVNASRGFFLVRLDDGSGFAVFESLSSTDVVVGDCVRGKLNAVGGQDLLHVGHGEVFQVYGQSGCSSQKACLLLLR